MSKPTKKPAIEPNVKGSTWAAIHQLGERMRQERIGDRQRAAEELARKKSATGPTVAILKRIDSIIAENKDNHEALKAIEAFLHESNRYSTVRRCVGTVSGLRTERSPSRTRLTSKMLTRQ